MADTSRPQAQVITTSRAKTKDTALSFVVQFTEAVFGFNSSSVIISGGRLTSFTEIDSSTYSLKVTAVNNNLVTVTVPENSTFDVAGNPNLGTSSAQVRHCKSLSTPFTCDSPSLKWQFNLYYSMVKKWAEFLLTSVNGVQIPCLQSPWCCFA
jgi:hypothetical protein